VTKKAYAMVVYFGLNKEIGNISFYDSSGQSEYSFQKPYSEKTAEVIDREVSKIIESAYDRAKTVITDNKEKVEKLSKALLDKEVIFREDLEEIFGKRPFEEDEKIKIIDLTNPVIALPEETGKPDTDPDPPASV
jgi:AFG3 family protein